jgi:predicted extracellular nuclease
MQYILSARRATALAVCVVACFLLCVPALAQGSPNLVISQVYGGGGNSGAPYTNDFVEIFNRGGAAVSLNGLSIQYASATGTGNLGTSSTLTVLPNVMLQPGQYFLVQEAGGATGVALPAADATGTINMSASAGKVALVNSTASLGCNGGSSPCSPTQLAQIIDLVGFGTANFYEGAAAPGLSNTTAALRAAQGCTDSNNNSTDFASGAPAPRNTTSAFNVCGASSAPAITNATASAEAGTSVLLKVVVVPGANPASTGLSVSADLSSIGGSSGQVFYDDGSNGDITAGDNVFSFSYTVPSAQAASSYTLPVAVIDNQSRSGSGSISLTVTPKATLYRINQLQGSGSQSPVDNTVLVKTTGVVTARKYNNGFFLQSLPADDDGDPNTSEGVFVYTNTAPPAAAAIGNVVEVRGYVSEFISGRGSNTEICGTPTCSAAPTVNLLYTDASLPAPVTITMADEAAMQADPNSLALEKYEGMRVAGDSLTTVAPTQGSVTESSASSTSNGVFFTTLTGLARPFREPGLAPGDPLPAGSPCCVPVFDGNPELIRVDSDGQIGASRIEVTSNQQIDGMYGVLDFSTGFYTILPDAASETTLSISNPMTAIPVPAPDAHEVTVGSFNLQRFYDDDSTTASGATLTAAAFQKRLAKASLAIRNVLHTPDVLAIQEMNNLSTLQTLAATISSDASAAGQDDPQYDAYLFDGNDPSFINLAFLVKKSRIDVVSVTQEGKDATFLNPTTNQLDLLNDRPPLVLKATVRVSGKEVSIPLTVIANHLRSLSGVNDPVDGRVRAKREAGAEFLAELIQGMHSENVISVGDYNAYQFSDGYVDVMGAIMGTPAPADEVVMASPSDLVTPHLSDLESRISADQRYSYTFDGSAQTLDHFLVNNNALGLITRFAYGRMDGDFPESYRNDATRPERISDHDPGVAYIAVPVDEVPPVVSVTGVTDGATYLLGLAPVAGCSTTDALSGVATNASVGISGGTSLGVGQFTATCSGAVDKVGNSADPVSVHYTVTFAFSGFASPLTAGGTYKSGSTVPLKFQLADGNGNLITSTDAVSVMVTGSCGGALTPARATGGSVLRYDSTAQQFVFNWKAAGTGCITAGIALTDTTMHTVNLTIR